MKRNDLHSPVSWRAKIRRDRKDSGYDNIRPQPRRAREKFNLPKEAIQLD